MSETTHAPAERENAVARAPHTTATARPPVEPIAVAIPEAARLAGIGRSTVYPAIMRGEIESAVIGRRRVVILASLREWVARQVVRPAP